MLLVRTGRWERVRQLGQWNFLEAAAGMHASVAKWLKARDVAVIGCDGVNDVMPSGVAGLANPLHQLVLVGLGMPILDNLNLDDVAAEAAQRGRWTFLLAAAPLRVPGGTGSPLNPLAAFFDRPALSMTAPQEGLCRPCEGLWTSVSRPAPG